MGASFAGAVRRARLFDSIVAYDLDVDAAERAVRAGVVDARVASIADGCRDADAVLVAVPPSAIVASVVEVEGSLGAHGTTVFDLGSVKAPVLTGLRDALGRLPARFVPCHPMAGAAASGPGAADPDLFRGRRVFLTPGPETDPGAVARIESWWRACGAEVRIADAAAHDRAVAATSHLPHLVAAVYAARFDGDASSLLEFAGPGFRDFTRIAGADAGLWRDILAANADAVAAELDRLLVRLAAVRRALEPRGAHVELDEALAAGRRARQVFARLFDGERHGGR
jgi:prephenate dehydrogenase